ncbi:MAG: NHL repeat-containing protein [Candidatus Wallbacteria bacterium]|nr:NHL repeat-containing protein [Candidatus Wallbacteria bacterium]
MNCPGCGLVILPDIVLEDGQVFLLHREKKYRLALEDDHPRLIPVEAKKIESDELLQVIKLEIPPEEFILRSSREPRERRPASEAVLEALSKVKQTSGLSVQDRVFETGIIENSQRSFAMYVVDSGNHRVLCLNARGEQQGFFGGYGQKPGSFFHPKKIARDSDGNLWVTDAKNCRLQKFNPNGGFLLETGKSGDEPGDFSYPAGIFHFQKRLYVADTLNHRIQIFNQDGSLVGCFGQAGEELGSLNRPYGISVEDDGSIWVSEIGQHRLQKFSAEGDPIFTVGSFGKSPENLNSPAGLLVNGEVVVADSGNHALKFFTRQGKFIRALSGPELDLNTPMDVLKDPGSKGFWVVDSWNHRIVRLTMDGRLEFATGRFGAMSGEFDTPTALMVV